MNYAVLTWGCWVVFSVTWIVGAIYNAYKGPAVMKKRSWPWRYWLIGLTVIVAFERVVPHHLWSRFRFDLPMVQMEGAIILIVCTLFTLWSRMVLGKMWSLSITLKSGHELCTDGPYRITRHPIYSGILGMLVGSVFTGGIIFLFVLVVAVIIFKIKIHKEEKLLIATFGAKYIEYKKQVPQLIPRLHLANRP